MPLSENVNAIKWTEDIIVKVLSEPLVYLKITVESGEQVTVQGKDLVYQMLQAMHMRQTTEEQRAHTTKENNGVGFNAMDAGFLSSVAINSQSYHRLTDKQAVSVGKTLRKYKKQILSIQAGRDALQERGKAFEAKKTVATPHVTEPAQKGLFR